MSNNLKKIPIGIDNFHKLIRENYLFCDKSLLIKEIIDEGSEVTLIVRPRRWGKTLNMSMIRHFFAPEVYGIKTKNLFDHLAIATVNNGDYLSHQGKYPVIFVSFKDVKESSFEGAFRKIIQLVRILYREHRYLLQSEKLAVDEKDLFSAYLKGEIQNNDLTDSLRFLSELLAKEHDENVYIIIDEYDTPINAAYEKYLEKMVGFMQDLFSAALKDNSFLKQGILTGILRVSKDSILSGLNNLKTYTLLDGAYKQHFGFSEEEVTYLFEQKGCLLQLNKVKKWYNGYKANDLTIYNPWSIINCLADQGKIDLYWTETAKNDLVENTIGNSNADIKSNLETLMQGGTITERIDKHVTFDILKNNETALWSLLLFTGYLKAESSTFDENLGGHICILSIPNLEVFCLYQQCMREWLLKNLGDAENQSDFLEDLAKRNIKQFTERTNERATIVTR